jgi:hypothetical protein
MPPKHPNTYKLVKTDAKGNEIEIASGHLNYRQGTDVSKLIKQFEKQNLNDHTKK